MMKHPEMKMVAMALLVAGVVVGCGNTQSKEKRSSAGKQVAENHSVYPKAPEFVLQDLQGKEIKLSDYSGKLVFVNFWATWCPPCRAEVPTFIKLYEQYHDQGLEIVGISTDQDGIGVVRDFVQRMKVNYPVVMFTMKVVRDYGGITGIPTTFVVNPMGEVVNKYVGYPGMAAFQRDIEKWLPQKAL